MKKFVILIFISFITVFDIIAQDTKTSHLSNLESKVDSLSVKLNTLQHDYDYLYCKYSLSEIQLELKDFINELNSKSNSILISCYNSRFNIDLYTSYIDNYNSCINLFDSMKEKIEGYKTIVALKIYISNFTEQEIKVLMSNYDFTDQCIQTAQNSLDYYKVVLDMYKKLR